MDRGNSTRSRTRGAGAAPPNPIHARARAAVAIGRKLLAPYLCAGWPTPDATLPLLRALADAGADWIELGVPFSDPLADGATLQGASEQALAQGMTLPAALEIAARFSAESRVPLALMTYANLLLRGGGADPLRRAASAGIAAVIVPDLPPEEWPRLRGRREAPGGDRPGADPAQTMPLVPLVAPNTPTSRVREVTAGDPPFLYCVAVLGVTGAREEMAEETLAFLARVRAGTSVPALVGFGVSSPSQAVALARHADGVIIGSALVDHLRGCSAGADLGAAATAFLGPIRAALDAFPHRSAGRESPSVQEESAC